MKRFPSESTKLGISGSTFTVTFDRPWSDDIRFSKREKPLVCRKCGSQSWVHAISEDRKKTVDFCMDCNSITDVVLLTQELYEKYHNCVIHPDYFESLWRKTDL